MSKIQELADKAKKSVPHGLTPDKWIEVYNTKFAELIVRECMACSTWVGKNNTDSVEPVHTAHAINQRIKKHFGDEE